MRHWRYKNTILFVLSLLITVLLSRYEPFHIFLLSLGDLGYIGAFFAGLLFVSSFTIATGALLLLVLAERLSLLEITIIAGLGGVVGNMVIFRFVKDTLVAEITPLYNKYGGLHLTALLHSKYFSWALPVLGALIIASPLPDELGVSLLGLSKMKTYKFLIISFIFNAIGIFFIVVASKFFKP